ncbi:MAG: phospholipase A [Muribaculaceae bacterium]|nr:phospholipase A [Muribaculaceae bacterium]
MAVIALCAPSASAQIVEMASEPSVNTDSLKRAFADQHYYFGLYKDNYFIFGPPINTTPDKHNTNIKFQISIAQKLTKSTLPWGTYLYLFYTQKVFWNVLENSMPMTDLNFNPGVGLTKPLFVKDRFIGKLSLILEHESNGRDGEASRSWNRVSFSSSIMVDPNFVVSAKVWIPIIDGQNNRDILKYCGIYQFGWQFQSSNRKLSLGVTLTKRMSGFFDYNTCIEAAWRWSVKSNQYLFMQFYNGYGEGLLDYNVYTSHIRVGIVIKPTLFSEF